MYLIPLNLDEPFKKVFGSPHVAKAFIQDMLNVKITSIEKLENDHKVTNAAALVRFDYRCQINDKYVIIEMQQGYKQDVVKRFFLYHCLNTALQLETIKETVVRDRHGKEHRTRNYVELESVITIVWMAQDNFDLEADYIEYNLYPKAYSDFIKHETLWQSSKSELEAERSKLLLHPKKDRRELSFLAQNRLIFVFQPNIIKNKRGTRYAKWFEFAEKTRNPNNKASDFDEFSNNSIFAQMIHRLTVKHVDNQDLIKEMGEEAYLAAKKLGEQVQKEEERHFMYWDIYDEITGQYKEEYDANLKAERELRYAAIDRAEEAMYEAAIVKRLLDKAQKENLEAQVILERSQKILEKEKMEAQKILEKEKMEAQKILEKEKMEAQKILEKEKMEAQKILEKEKIEVQKILKKEKMEAQKILEKEKMEAQKILEKEKMEAQKILEKEKTERVAAKKLLQEEQKKARKLEKEQKKLLEQKQIKLMNNLLTVGLSVDVIAKSLEVSVEQIVAWQKIKK
ncbi:MAG: hypothetical protein RLZZ628_2961 [Bacteroidota bacterium]|jgi:hypothetical protein